MLGLFEEIWWRYQAYPRTLQAAARDFLENRKPERVRAVLADSDSYHVDFKRRIGTIYGLARDFNVLTTVQWSAGWNQRLLSDVGPDPEEAAERILQRVCEMA